MTDLTTDELRALVEAADAGPWVIDRGDDNEAWINAANGWHVCCVYDRASDGSGEPQFDEACEANAALIAASPSLAAEVLALREERERLRGALALTDKALRPAVVQAAGGPRIAEIGAWLATADDAIGLIEAALAEPQS
jgi:hypothetical protein